MTLQEEEVEDAVAVKLINILHSVVNLVLVAKVTNFDCATLGPQKESNYKIQYRIRKRIKQQLSA